MVLTPEERTERLREDIERRFINIFQETDQTVTYGNDREPGEGKKASKYWWDFQGSDRESPALYLAFLGKVGVKNPTVENIAGGGQRVTVAASEITTGVKKKVWDLVEHHNALYEQRNRGANRAF